MLPCPLSIVSSACRLIDQWLQTDLGGRRADLPPETGAKAIVDMVQNATPEQNGRFFNIHVPGWEENKGFNQYDGKKVPW